ncbi:MAG: hypothetical protein JW797_03445 [Bradymonadales bacterium]|nr:hypothetical protein [Bradymonadales bacterium]
MNQLTIRGFDERLAKAIRDLAKKERISLNKAALRLLEKGAGLEEGKEDDRTVGKALDHLLGTWTESEEREFLAAIDACEQVDEEMWK